MDVRDSPRRPPRERLSEGSGRGKSSAEIGREAGPGARPPRASRPEGPFSGAAAPGLRRDRAFNTRILPRLPTLFPRYLPPQPPHLNVLVEELFVWMVKLLAPSLFRSMSVPPSTRQLHS